jgi:hypothetical protein
MNLRNITASIANGLFLPVNINYKDRFAVPLRILVALFFIYSVIIAIPSIISFVLVKENNIYLPLMTEFVNNAVVWKTWLPFVSFLLEIIFFLMIGGSVFSEWIASHSKEAIEKYETAIVKATENEVESARGALEKEIYNYNNLLKADITFSDFIPTLWDLYKISNTIMQLTVKDIPRINARFIVSKLVISFPGGTYGLVAFIIFGALIQVKIGQMYLAVAG